MARRIQYQSLALVARAIPLTLGAILASSAQPNVVKKPFAASEQQFSSFQPAGFIRSDVPYGWNGPQLESRLAKPLAASEQQFLAHDPQDVPLPVDVQGWNGIQLDTRLAQPFPAKEQQFNSFQPAGFIQSDVPYGWNGIQLEFRFANPFPVTEQKLDAFAPAGFIRSDVPYGWNGIQLEARLARPFPTAGQQFLAHDPQVIAAPPIDNTTYGGPSLFGVGPERFTRRFPVAAQQFNGLTAQIVPASPTTIGWGSLCDVVLVPETQAGPLQQFTSFQAQGFIRSDVPYGFWGFQLDARLSRPFPVQEQRFSDFQPQGEIVAVVYLEGFRGLQLEFKLAKPFPANEQRFSDFQPAGFIRSDVPYGWWGLQLDTQFGKRFPIAQQQFTDRFTPRGNVPLTVGQEGWRGLQLDARLLKPFPIAQQQFSDRLTPRGTIPPQEGWRGLQLDARLGKPFPVQAQQFSDRFQPRGNVPLTVGQEGWRGFQLEARLARPFAASLQQFLARIAPPIVPPPPDGFTIVLDSRFAQPFPVTQQVFWIFGNDYFVPPPGAGKRRDFPSYIPQPAWDKKPNKPFRPIWDKARGEEKGFIEPVVVITPQGPVPLPPADLFGVAGDAQVTAPNFDHLVPGDIGDLGRRLRAAMDASDALAALKAFNPPAQPEPSSTAAPTQAPDSATPSPRRQEQPRRPTVILKPAPNPHGLPNFDHLAPHDVGDLSQRMRQAMDASDALSALKAFQAPPTAPQRAPVENQQPTQTGAQQPAVPPRPEGHNVILNPPPNPHGLPSFDHLVPQDHALSERMKDSQDMSDAMRILKALGLIKD